MYIVQIFMRSNWTENRAIFKYRSISYFKVVAYTNYSWSVNVSVALINDSFIFVLLFTANESYMEFIWTMYESKKEKENDDVVYAYRLCIVYYS